MNASLSQADAPLDAAPNRAQPSTPARVRGRTWFGDFEYGLRGLTVRKTGAFVPFTAAVFAEVGAWFLFFLAVSAAKPEPGPPFTIAFHPDRARPWYLAWAVARLAGGRPTTKADRADVVMHFDDATYAPNPPPTTKPGAVLLNFGCVDVSKSKVAEAFEAAFGYGLRLDPAETSGPLVEKSEDNGVHDGRILEGPAPAQPGKTYQRLVDNRTSDRAFVEDLRTPLVGGEAVVVFRKRREVGRRFANANAAVTAARPEDVFTTEERARLTAFAQRLGLDWGGVDVLRDRQEGRLYIVDANKTDMGPPTALPLADKMRAARALAKALRQRIGR